MSLQTHDNIRRLQKKLYLKATAEPDFRFYLLYDKIYREDILYHAYELAGLNGLRHVRISGDGPVMSAAALLAAAQALGCTMRPAVDLIARQLSSIIVANPPLRRAQATAKFVQ